MTTDIIYIAGYGRSGTTLLDRLLASHRQVFTVGELGRLPRTMRAPERYRCSCGAQIDNCVYWPSVWKQVAASLSMTPEELGVATNVDSLDGWRSLLLTDTSDSSYNRALLAAIGEAAHRPRFILDSSKTGAEFASRPLALAAADAGAIRLIHIIRDGRGVVWSRIKADQRRYDRILTARERIVLIMRSALSWTAANLSAYVVGRRLGNRIVITYETLATEPGVAIARLHQQLGLDPTDVDEDQVRHQAHGNRMRMSKDLSIRLDESWRQELTLLERMAFWLVGWPGQMVHRRHRRQGR